MARALHQRVQGFCLPAHLTTKEIRLSENQDRCPCGNKARRRGLCDSCREKEDQEDVTVATQIATDRQLVKATLAAKAATSKYQAALKEIEKLDRSLGVMEALRQGPMVRRIEPKHGEGTSEASVVLVASDWHSEERVNGESVNFLNEFNLEIADQRIQRFWQSSERLVRLLKQDVKVDTIVLGLLGDFITGQIHGAENAEMNALLPMDAICWVQDRITSGIEFILENHKGKLVIVCKVGNHGRTTHQTRLNGEENGHSLEFLMYVNLKMYFRNEPRVSVVIDRSYHTFMDIYDVTVRFHHGHRLRYGGGRGGLFTPTYDAIDNWNKAKRANLDIFGHFHQKRDGGNFMCNGSLIGYNGFAQAIKASYETPTQTLALIDKKRGRTCTWPILLERK